MKRILITGAAGFIGSHLTERLLADGCRVCGLDNFVDFYDPADKRRNLSAAMKAPHFELVEADIRDARAVDSAVERFKPMAIIHLAAMAGVRPSIQQPALYTDINLVGTTRLLDAAVKYGVQRFIFGSSSSVYGNNPQVPFCESDPVDNPISPYAATKRAGELICHTYWHIHRLPVTCLRFFTVYGPRQRPDLAIHKFMKLIATSQPIQVFGDGSTSRDYTFIHDILDGITAALDRCDAFDIINLGSHAPVKLLELIRAIEKVVGIPAKLHHHPMQPGDVERTCADLAHASQRLGYHPGTRLEDGLKTQWDWLLSRMRSAVAADVGK